jgi:cold shock CspA family protein
MKVSPKIIFHDMDRSEWVEDYIRERLQKLDRIADGLTSAEVIMTRAHGSHHKGNVYTVMVSLRLPPNHELAAKKERGVGDMQMELRPLIKSTFEAVERQLKAACQRRRNDVKRHGEEPRGTIEQIHPDGYGFIRALDDQRQYYFHRNSVLHDQFDSLNVGTEVRFNPEEGEDGPQASSVQVAGKRGAHASTSETTGAE